MGEEDFDSFLEESHPFKEDAMLIVPAAGKYKGIQEMVEYFVLLNPNFNPYIHVRSVEGAETTQGIYECVLSKFLLKWSTTLQIMNWYGPLFSAKYI